MSPSEPAPRPSHSVPWLCAQSSMMARLWRSAISHSRRHVGRAVVEVDGDDRARAGGDVRFHLRRVDAVGIRLDIHQDRHGIYIQAGSRRGLPGVDRHDHLVAVADVQRFQRQLQGHRAIGHRQAVPVQSGSRQKRARTGLRRGRRYAQFPLSSTAWSNSRSRSPKIGQFGHPPDQVGVPPLIANSAKGHPLGPRSGPVYSTEKALAELCCKQEWR